MTISQNPYSDTEEFQIGIDWAKVQGERAAYYIYLPNDTELIVHGDPEIVKQLLKIYDGHTITYVKYRKIS